MRSLLLKMRFGCAVALLLCAPLDLVALRTNVGFFSQVAWAQAERVKSNQEAKIESEPSPPEIEPTPQPAPDEEPMVLLHLPRKVRAYLIVALATMLLLGALGIFVIWTWGKRTRRLLKRPLPQASPRPDDWASRPLSEDASALEDTDRDEE